MNNENMQSSSAMNMGMDDSSQDTGASASGQSGSVAGGVKKMAAQAGEKLMDTAEQQKRAGADYVTDIAGAVRRAAGEFEEQVPQAAEYIRYAADQIETMSDSLRRRDLSQMMTDVQSFARRQPTAFLGMTFLAGFAAVRFLRSTSPMRSSSGSSSSSSWDQRRPMQDDRYGAPSDAAAMRPVGSAPPNYGM